MDRFSARPRNGPHQKPFDAYVDAIATAHVFVRLTEALNYAGTPRARTYV
jgi:hypothetical protein